MSTVVDAPVDLYVAAYDDPDAAREDWDALKALARDDAIKLDGLILVSRRSDGKIHVEDNFHRAGKGAIWGAVGGAVVGLIFPPSLLVDAAVGAGIGAGLGGLVSHRDKALIKADVEETLPINSSGIVALVEEQWAETVHQSFVKASTIAQQEVDADSVQEVKTAVADKPPAATT